MWPNFFSGAAPEIIARSDAERVGPIRRIGASPPSNLQSVRLSRLEKNTARRAVRLSSNRSLFSHRTSTLVLEFEPPCCGANSRCRYHSNGTRNSRSLGLRHSEKYLSGSELVS